MSIERNLKEQATSQSGIRIVNTFLPGLPDAAPPIAYYAGNRYKDADIVRFGLSWPPSILITSPKAFEFVVKNAKAIVDRSPTNTRMGKETNTAERDGPQFGNLDERDTRRQSMNEKGGKGELLAHTVVGRILSKLPESSAETLQNIAKEVVESHKGSEIDAKTLGHNFVNKAIWKVLFNDYTQEEVQRMSELVDGSIPIFGAVAFLGEWMRPLLKLKYNEVYLERDRILELITQRNEVALQNNSEGLAAQIWRAFYAEGMVRFDGDEARSIKHAELNTTGYLNTLFQAAADTTVGPAGNTVSLMGLEENRELPALLKDNEEALNAAVYVSLGLNSSLPADPHILTESLTIGKVTYPKGTRIGFDLSSVAMRELEEYTGMSVENHSFHELVVRTIEVSREREIPTLTKALRSYAFKTGIRGACMGNGFAVKELACFIEAVSGHVETITEGSQKATILLNRVDSTIRIK